MSNKQALLLVVVLSLSLSGCGAGEAKQAAETTINTYFAAFQAKDWDKVHACCSPTFFTKISKENYTKLLQNLESKLGAMKSKVQTGYRYQTGSSTQLTITYDVQYDKGKATETFLFTGSPDASGYQITGHNIQSQQLLVPQQ